MPRSLVASESAPASASAGSVASLIVSFERACAARNLSPRTIQSYYSSLARLAAFLKEQGMPQQVSAITREHVEAWIGALLDGVSARTGAPLAPRTVEIRYKAANAFFRWAVEEGEIPASPMVRMRPPVVPVAPVAVLDSDALRRLLKGCEGKDFRGRRDMAILRLLIDTGMRRGELGGLRVADVDWEHQVVHVLGKGRRPRPCPFGRKTAQALDRYLRARAAHDATEPSSMVHRAA